MFLLFIILVFLQSSFLPVNLLLAAILALAMIKIDKNLILVVFLTGLLFDILNVRLVGTTSLFYLSVCLILFLYQKKFKTQNFLYIVLSGLIVLAFDNWLFNKNISILKLLLETVSLLLWYSFFSFWSSGNRNLWLKN